MEIIVHKLTCKAFCHFYAPLKQHALALTFYRIVSNVNTDFKTMYLSVLQCSFVLSGINACMHERAILKREVNPEPANLSVNISREIIKIRCSVK